jgi:hypothetical protein
MLTEDWTVSSDLKAEHVFRIRRNIPLSTLVRASRIEEKAYA